MAKDLSLEERIIIAVMRLEGKSYAAIAKHVGRAKSTIYAEMKRNRTRGCVYKPSVAQAKADRRRRKQRVKRRMQTAFVCAYVKEHLRQYWSPEQIAGRIRLEYPRASGQWISHETIYKWVWRQKKLGGLWHKYLRSGLKKTRRRHNTRESRGRIVGRVGIEERPGSVDSRRFVGDWEGDTVLGGHRRSRIASCVERKTRYVCLSLTREARLGPVIEGILGRFHGEPRLPVRSITLDNGREFTNHSALSDELGCRVYFARPYHAWERGLNENTNGLLRQFYPKGMDLREVTEEELATVERMLNTRPRKCLRYRTPEEEMTRMLSRRVRIGI